MCTAAAYRAHDFYFGRNLDYEFSYGESIVVTPRSYPFNFRCMGEMSSHYAMIGVAHVAEDYPLYYEAVNEKGLGIAGLNFVGNAFYPQAKDGCDNCDNVSPFEFIPWIAGQCASVREARERLCRIRLVNIPFSEQLPLSSLHWMIADSEETIVVESVKDGLKIYDDLANVLTNNPEFDKQLFRLNDYMALSPYPPENKFAGSIPLERYSRGMGALGLPGDLSSQSRFIRAAYVLANSRAGDSEAENVSQFFHILSAVEQQKGCCSTDDGKWEYTIYSCCANASQGVFYYTTYDNSQITAVDMHKENLNGDRLAVYPMLFEQKINLQN